MERRQFILRFDEDVYDGIKKLASDSSISVNQLMQGIARWAVRYGHSGEAGFVDSPYEIEVKPQPGCVWFGHTGEDFIDRDGNPGTTSPEIYFQLDFTERHVIREEEPRARWEEEN